MTDSTEPSPRDNRGRHAYSPMHIPLRGWWDVLVRVWFRISEDSLSLVAAGVAFFAFLALFPGITALLSIFGLLADPSSISAEIGSLKGTVPDSALQILQQQVTQVASGSGAALSIGLAISIALALYSASKGANALIMSLNIAYGEHNQRSIVRSTLLTMGVTLSSIFFTIMLLLVIGVPGYLQQLDLPTWLNVAIRIVRWVIVLALMMAALAIVYAIAPHRRPPRLRWLTPGAILATVFWLIASIGFSFYISNFGSYNKTYGSTAAIAILMMWFWISAFVVLIGAELNAELEAQTYKDSTRGRDRPRGDRRANAADIVKGVAKPED